MIKYIYIILLLLTPVALLAAGKSNEKNNMVIHPSFIENKGQVLNQDNIPQTDVLYTAKYGDLTLNLKKDGFSYLFAENNSTATHKHTKECTDIEETPVIKMHRVDVKIENLSQQMKVVAELPQQAKYNYYINGLNNSNLRTYNRILYKNVYPEIDMEFLILDEMSNDGNWFKINWIVGKNADIADIKLLYKGFDKLAVKNDKTLQFTTSIRNFNEEIPQSYFLNSKKAADIRYDVKFNKNNEAQVGFKSQSQLLKTESLVIDPWITYFGTERRDDVYGVDFNESGSEIAFTGYSISATLFSTTGVYKDTITGGYDFIIFKFNNAGTLLWCTYYGGTLNEISRGCKINSAGEVIISGSTGSSNGIATPGAYQTVYGGGATDMAIAKFSANGGTLIWGTYIGSTGAETGTHIDLNASDDIVFTGYTNSATGIATAGAHQTVYAGGNDGVIGKVSNAGVPYWITYYGDTGDEILYNAAFDWAGNIYIVGRGAASTGTTVTTTGAYQTTNAGGNDAVLIKFNGAGVRQWGTYIGGAGTEWAYGVRVSTSGTDVHIAGETSSSTGIATAGAYQPALAASSDVFVATFDNSGNIKWSTYFGGNGADIPDGGLDIDKSGNIYFTGRTFSNNLPVSVSPPPLQATYGGAGDGFLASFSPTGAFRGNTYLGGTGEEFFHNLAIDKQCNIVFAGHTSSRDYPVLNAWQPTYAQGIVGASDFDIAIAYGDPVFFGFEDGCILPIDTVDCEKITADTLCVTYQMGVTYNWILPTGVIQTGALGDSCIIVDWSSVGNDTLVTVCVERTDTVSGCKDTLCTDIYIPLCCPTITNNLIVDNQSICSGTTADSLIGTVATLTPSGTPLYQWQSSTDSLTWANISGATTQNYGPDVVTQTTWYRRIVGVADTTCTKDTSNAVKITVNPVPSVTVQNVQCNDNGTPYDPSDDRIIFELNVTGVTGSYTVSGITGLTPTTGTASGVTTFTTAAGSAGAGNLSGTVAINGCSSNFSVTDPGVCCAPMPNDGIIFKKNK